MKAIDVYLWKQRNPDLPPRPGRIWAAEANTIFGSFADASPDEWGQRIIQAAHARAAKADGVRANRLSEFDYVLEVADSTRMGALRMRAPGSDVWLSSDDGLANTHELPRLLDAAHRDEAHEETDDDIACLLCRVHSIPNSGLAPRPRRSLSWLRMSVSVARGGAPV